VRENQTLVAEDLNLKGMIRNRKLARALSGAALSELIHQLEYKACWYGRTFIKVDRFFPSTKRCSACGFVLGELGLNERHWSCPDCGVFHDRDVNAARNLREEGLRMAHVPPGGREQRRVEGGNPPEMLAGPSNEPRIARARGEVLQ
jgi:putative transposase